MSSTVYFYHKLLRFLQKPWSENLDSVVCREALWLTVVLPSGHKSSKPSKVSAEQMQPRTFALISLTRTFCKWKIYFV